MNTYLMIARITWHHLLFRIALVCGNTASMDYHEGIAEDMMIEYITNHGLELQE